MVGLINSFKKFTIILTFLIILGFCTVYLFDLFIAVPINLSMLSKEALRLALILGFSLVVLLLIRHAKSLMTSRIGVQAATVLQFSMGVVAVLVMSFGVLDTLGVSPTSLLAGAGIASITIGLIISTFVGGILAGAMVFTTQRFREGDDVLVNNIPGRIIGMTTLVTKIRTEMG